MNATKPRVTAHDFDPRTGCCTRCGLSEIEMYAMLQRLQGYKLLDAALSERPNAEGWRIDAETRALYAHLASARDCL